MAGERKGGGTGRGIQQSVPPYGIKSKVWRRKTPSTHSPKYHGASSFTIACANRQCEKRHNSGGDILMSDKSVHCGVKAPTICPGCGQPYPKSGYIGGEIPDVRISQGE